MAEQLTATEIIDREFNNAHNPLTPHRVECMMVGKHAIEIARGLGMSGQPIFGVSVVDYDRPSGKTTRRNDLHDMFQSEQAARDYIATLRDKE